MNKLAKLGKGLAALTGTAVLATPQSAQDDATNAAMHVEESRYERSILDFESSCAASGIGCARSILKISA